VQYHVVYYVPEMKRNAKVRYNSVISRLWT